LLNGRVATQAESPFYGTLRAFNERVFVEYNSHSVVVPFFKAEENNLDGLMIVQVGAADA
jgi:hypothetical protein